MNRSESNVFSVIKIALQDIDHYIPRTIARLLEGKLYTRMKTKKEKENQQKSKEKKNAKRSGIWPRKSAFSVNRKSKNISPDNDEGGHSKLETESSKTEKGHPDSSDKGAIEMHYRSDSNRLASIPSQNNIPESILIHRKDEEKE
jgi:hypothetical protein